MKKIYIVLLLAASMLAWSCSKENEGTTPEPANEDVNSGGFDFATTKIHDLKIDYVLNGYESQIDFEVYTEYPFTSVNSRQLKGIDPILRAYTDVAGKFDGEILIPIHAKQLYLRSIYSGVPSVVTLSISDGTISFNANELMSAQPARSRATHTVPSDIYTINEWDALGYPTPNSGITKIPSNLSAAYNAVFKEGVNISTQYSKVLGKIPVLNISKNNGAHTLLLTFVHSDGVDLNSLGYYSYPTATPPTSLDQVKKTLVLPNTTFKNQGGNLVSGNTFQLMYWDGSDYVAQFPKGTSVGFFVIRDGFDAATGNIEDNARYYSNYDLVPAKQQIAAFGNSGNGIFVAGVEMTDRSIVGASDNDFNDLLFYVEPFPRNSADFSNLEEDPNPEDPEEDPDPKPIVNTYKGTLIFEDLWPYRGDYDINDVVVEYTCEQHFDINNNITKIVDKFYPINNGAELQNGFAYRINATSSAISSRTFTTTYPGSAVEARDYTVMPTDFSAEPKSTVLLFDDIRKPGFANGGYEYQITTVFNTPQTQGAVGFPPYDSFVVIIHGVGADPRNRELHLANQAPTTYASIEWFGYANDLSVPAQGVYYISDSNYPFAINIPVQGFKLAPETQKIDDVYSEYYNWATSYGNMNTEWYLHPNF